MRNAARLAIAFALVVGCGRDEAHFAPGEPHASAAHEAEHAHAAEVPPADMHPTHAADGVAQPECGQPGHHCEHSGAAVEAPGGGVVQGDGSRLFGTALSERAPTSLAQITAAPADYDGQTVVTSGTIERVCQRMGCWMELRDGDAPPVRVPMAGHSFFLPRDSGGRQATIEGRVRVQVLTADARAHLESEGARETGSSLAIEATGVVIR